MTSQSCTGDAWMCTIYDCFSQPFLICSGHPSGLRLPEHWIHCCHGYQGQTWGAVSMTGLGWQLQLLSTYQLNKPFFLRYDVLTHLLTRMHIQGSELLSLVCKAKAPSAKAPAWISGPIAPASTLLPRIPHVSPPIRMIFFIIFYLRCSIICPKKVNSQHVKYHMSTINDN
jgi:hypothetical protein